MMLFSFIIARNMLICHEPERDNPNDIRMKLAQNVEVAHKMASQSSDLSDPHAVSEKWPVSQFF